jgi:hypothetical protein
MRLPVSISGSSSTVTITPGISTNYAYSYNRLGGWWWPGVSWGNWWSPGYYGWYWPRPAYNWWWAGYSPITYPNVLGTPYWYTSSW